VKRWEKSSLNILSFIVTLTGFGYFWMKYFVQASDPFAVVNHPWQTTTLNLHVMASPFLILMGGIVFNSHVMKKLRAQRLPNRRSGYASLGTFAAMVLSGYLLQISVDQWWLRALMVVHVTAGVVFSIAYGAHLVISVRLVRRLNPVIREVA
jgi:hypothetical protein